MSQSDLRSASTDATLRNAAPGAELTQAADSNVNGTHHVLPASAKVQLHELTSENAVLKARLRSTAQELKNTRELCQKLSASGKGKTGQRVVDRDTSNARDSAVQTKELKGLRPLAAALRTSGTSAPAASLTSCTVAVQTIVGGKDCIVVPANGSDSAVAAALAANTNDQVRRLKAEVLRSHAECASLHHAIQIMKTHGTASSPTRSTQPSCDQALFPDQHKFVTETKTAEAHQLAKESHLAAMERIATLTEALKQANERVADLERDLSTAKTAAVEARAIGAGDLLVSVQVAKLNKETITDDAQLDVRLPPSEHLGDGALERVARSGALEQALSITRAQLNEALNELNSTRAGTTAVHALPKNLASVGVTADLHQPMYELFRAHGLEVTTEVVEELLDVRTRHLELVRRTRELEATALTTTNSTTVRELMADLDSARRELTAAHQHIDELHYALDLEKRERYNPQNAHGPGSDRGTVSDESHKQAAAEIAFLCDTLAATKVDAESLRAQLEQASMERDSALHSFRELKTKTETVLVGCQQITEATRADADAAIANLTHSARSKDSEIFSLRGQIASLQRDLEKAHRTLSASQKEAESAKQRVATVQSAMSKLREDSTAQGAQLREVRAQLAALHASAISTPRGSTTTPRPHLRSPPSAQKNSATAGEARSTTDAGLSSIQALQRALDEREAFTGAARRLGDFGSPSPTLTRSRSASPSSGKRAGGQKQNLAVVSPKATQGFPTQAAPSVADGMEYEELKAEYEELRACFLVLTAMAPNAMTAREVTDALTAAFEAQKERCAAVEKELRKRTTTLQALKKELTLSRDAVAELEKRTSQTAAYEQRITALGRQLDKHKRAAAQLATEHDESDTALKRRISALESELETTRESLAQARQELREGRQLMLSLIGEDEEALATLLRNEAKLSGDDDNTLSRASVATSA